MSCRPAGFAARPSSHASCELSSIEKTEPNLSGSKSAFTCSYTSGAAQLCCYHIQMWYHGGNAAQSCMCVKRGELQAAKGTALGACARR